MLLLLIFINHAISYGFLKKKNNPYILYNTILLLFGVYIIIRGPITNSVHQFSNSILMKTDLLIFYTIIPIYIGIIVLCMYKKKYTPFKYLKVVKKKIYLTATIMSIVIITTVVAIKPLFNITNDKFFFKKTIILFCIFLRIFNLFSLNIKKVFRVDTDHLVIFILISSIVFIWEVPNQYVYLNNINGREIKVQLCDS